MTQATIAELLRGYAVRLAKADDWTDGDAKNLAFAVNELLRPVSPEEMANVCKLGLAGVARAAQLQRDEAVRRN